MPVQTDGELLTLDVAAERFGVSQSTLRFWRYSGKLSKIKRGNRVLVDSEEVRRLVEESQQIKRED